MTFPVFGDDIFWEDPEVVVPRGVKFIQTASHGNVGLAAWQEFDEKGPDLWDVYLSFAYSSNGRTFGINSRFAGPFEYRGKQVPLYSVVFDSRGRMVFALITGEHTISIFVSDDDGNSFREETKIVSENTVVVPTLFVASNNDLLLFVTSKQGNDLGIFLSRSTDAKEWSIFTPLVGQNEGIGVNAVQHHTVFRGRDYVVYQAKKAAAIEDYQLYMKISRDGGKSWTQGKLLTDFSEVMIPGTTPTPPSGISNQRPFLSVFDNELYLAWERNLRNDAPQIYTMTLNDAGNRVGNAVKITQGNASCFFPQIVVYRNTLYYLWFDNSQGLDHVRYGWFDAGKFIVHDGSPVSGVSQFPRPVFWAGHLHVFWENTVSGSSRLMIRRPDIYVPPPKIIPVNFVDDARGKLGSLTVSWNEPKDSAGIALFEYSYGRNDSFNNSAFQQVDRSTRTVSFDISGEGAWYFFVRAKDFAGNYSQPSRVIYTRDSTPPGKVRFREPKKDAEGFLLSNTFTIEWDLPSGEPISGYAYSLKYLSSDYSSFLADEKLYPSPGSNIQVTSSQKEFSNIDNGIWVFSVRAVDKAGNSGESASIVFKLRNYIDVTYITSVTVQPSPLGELAATLFGRGFAAGGLVEEVIIDRDAKQPWDYSFRRSDKHFTVDSDRFIRNLVLPDVNEGTYRVGVHHPVRGLYFTSDDVLRVDSAGTVKFGKFDSISRPDVGVLERFFINISMNEIILWLILGFLAVLFVIASRRIMLLAGEAASYKQEVQALFTTGAITMKDKKAIKQLTRQGISLRLKFTVLISSLVLLIVLMVAFPISVSMVNIQQKTLAEKLEREVDLVLGGISEGVKDELQRNSIFAMDIILERQFSLLADAGQYAIVTGPTFINPKTGQKDPTGFGNLSMQNLENIRAFVDANIKDKIKGGGEYIRFVSEIEDDITPQINEIETKINDQGKERIAELSIQIEKIRSEIDQTFIRGGVDSEAKRNELIITRDELDKKLRLEIDSLSRFIGSYPAFDPANVDLNTPSVLFYKPIVQIITGYDNYYWGMVRLGVSMEKIRAEITASRQALVIQVGIIAFIAIGLGIAGALILASITISPIRRLRAGVAVIRDTVDKADLKDHVITVKTRDEIRELADTVNQMTQGLVKAAVASKELTVGKEVQKMFIPLELDASGTKRTTGHAENKFIEIFGYYEGAKGVSGDYFDFKQLDDKHFAIIKCDVAGKGVPAALIMVEVATIFLNFFRDWSVKKNGTKIDSLAYRINDLVEERGFKGRFAALTLCLLNTETGACIFCNAGDNIVQHYVASQKKMDALKLPDAPAAGVFPSDLVEMQSGFKQVVHTMQKGDTLFLFTDGLEEAKRYFRDADFNIITCQEESVEDGKEHGGTHIKGSDNEEMGLPRFYGVVEALFAKTAYALSKYHNPIAGEVLTFDFASSEGSIDEAVLAPVSMEKVFRLVLDPAAGKDDLVRVDKKIDAFLSKYFSQYNQYFKNRIEREDETDYVYFSHLKEDEQYDDLTIIAVRKK
ncbi:MAG: SpoIIE family protein phosphatase [Spirochaetales bacterium]|nr:SpoIIE family protein phosphatase [Spirochaetales bacterium]